MGLNFTGKQKVFVDTAPFIYYLEDHPDYGELVTAFFQRVEDAGGRLLTSPVTYMEILTQPIKAGDAGLVDKYRDFFTNADCLDLLPVTPEVAEAAAGLRARHGVRTPDALQVASARVFGADHLLTNDRAWRKVPGVSVLTMEDLQAA